MPQCPQCNKTFQELPRKCPTCQAELDLLVDYVGQLQVGLDQAERLTRSGELGQAVWAYLSVLEVDPDNPTARRQVGQVATAVRQFDRTAPGRRWLLQIRGEPLPFAEKPRRFRWVWRITLLVLFFIVFSLGFLLGGSLGLTEIPDDQPEQKIDQTMGGRK